jgi:Domain of unknown function (DUF4173)
MKKNDWLLLLAVALYSFLFYQQTPGLNYLLFSVFLVSLLGSQAGNITRKHPAWLLTAAASLLTGFQVAFINTGLAVGANIVSLILLAGFSLEARTSLYVTAVNALYSICGSFFLRLFSKVRSPEAGQAEKQLGFAHISHRLPVMGIPLLVFLVFLFLYRSASPAFSHLVALIDLSFISWSWVWFTFLGFWLLYGCLRPLQIFPFTRQDLATGNSLVRRRQTFGHPTKKLGLKHEYRASYLSLLLLNGLLLAFNLSDGYYLTIGSLPADIPYADYLHQGVNTLIFSILLAIGILLYVFRGNLNFIRSHQSLKTLAYLWLAQNLVLVLLTGTKTSIYVQDFGLTYKRIGVYTYLLLTGIGLVTSLIKIRQTKNQWYLFRKNTWALYLVLVLSSCCDWDRLITHYNLTAAREPDLSYLVYLSDSGLAERVAHIHATQPGFNDAQKQLIVEQKNRFLEQAAQKAWPSWNYKDWRLQQALR